MRGHRLLLFVTCILMLGCANSGSAGELLFFLAVKTEPAYPGAPPVEVPSGPDWLVDTFTTVAGIEVPIVRKRTPEISLPMKVINEVEMYQPPSSVGLFPESTVFATKLVVGPQARPEFEAVARQHTFYSVVVVYAGRAIDLATVTITFADEIPGGTFRSEEEAKRFYAPLQDRLYVKALSSDEVRRFREFNDASKVWWLWHLKCDDSHRDEMRQDGWDVDRLLEELGDDAAGLDCSSEPPEFPSWSGPDSPSGS